MKTYSISFEGIDKVGKWQVLKYVDLLANHKYVLMDRGLMSNITYARIFKRDYQYDLEQFKDWIFVYLFCDEDDWNIRCKLTNEPAIDYTKHRLEFDKTYDMFTKAGFKTMSANTSHVTPYDLAKEIIRQIEELNKAEEILSKKAAETIPQPPPEEVPTVKTTVVDDEMKIPDPACESNTGFYPTTETVTEEPLDTNDCGPTTCGD